MQHLIKTVYGISKGSYGHSEEFGNWGEGQGAGLYILNTCKQFVASRIGEAYVDDANNAAIDQHTQQTDTQISITEKITKIAQTWEKLLFDSGGKLSIKKSRCYMFWWVWKNGKPHSASKEEAPAEALISEGRTAAKTILPQIEPDMFLRQLGVLTNLLKKWTDEFDKRLKKTTEMSQHINKAYITPNN
eukprot:4755054-Ditylum_brightwellii.AAC.1